MFGATDFGFSDPNDTPANSLQAVKITTLPGAGTLTDNGVAVTAGQFVSVADITAGKLVFTPAANANGNNYASFTFQVQDNGGTGNGGVDLDPTPNTITFNVTADVAPVAQNGAASGDEDQVTPITGQAVATDADTPANQLTYSLVGVNGGATHGAVVMNTDGTFSYTPAANFNGTDSFTFRANDGSVDSNSATITINVTPVNDAPSGTSATVTTNEDTGYVFGVADFGFSDPNDNPANSLLAVKITTLPGAGTLTDNGVAVTAGQFVSVADITAGKLVFTPAANANGNNYAQFTFQVQDNGGTGNGGVDLDPTPKTLTVNVTPVNDAPSGTSATVTTNEDTGYVFGVADFGFSDPNDTPANSLQAVKVTTLPGAGTLTDNGVAVTAGQFVSVADITAGKLVFTPAANANGNNYAQFTFQVQDNGGTGNGGVDLDPTPKTLTVNVTPVNDAPSGASATVTTNEDTGYVFGVADFGFSDPNDTPANSLQAVKVTTLPGAGTLTDNGVAVTAGQFVSVADITAGKLVFTPAANANGNNYASFTFQVQDNGGTGNGGVDLDPTPKTLTVNVTPVNDAPSGANATVTTNEDTGYVFGVADFGFSDPNDNPANSLQAVKVTTLPGAGTLTDNGVAVTAGQFVSVADITAGKLVFTPAANANGNNYASFTFQVQDNGGTGNGGVDLDPTPKTLTVNVTPVNDAPSGTSATVTTNEDTGYVFGVADFGFSDPNDTPANSLQAVKITTLPGAGTLTDNGVAVTAGQFVSVADITAGKLVFTPAANANGNNYASVHVPGAGQRRHRQWRG